MSSSNFLNWFSFMLQRFWQLLNNVTVFGSALTLKDLLISFMLFAVVWGFVFRKVMNTEQ